MDVLIELTNLVFYDYTKILGKVKKYKDYSHRYKITFSKSEENTNECLEALSIGSPVSVVFNRTKGQELPKQWRGYKVLDGDESDDLMLDNNGAYVIGLRFKGSKKDMQQAIESGFAVEV